MSRVSHCTVLINNCQLQRGCLSENSIKTVIVCKIKTPKYNAKLGINHMPGRKKKLSKWLSSRVKPKGMLNISNKLFFLQCLQAVYAKRTFKKGGKKSSSFSMHMNHTATPRSYKPPQKSKLQHKKRTLALTPSFEQSEPKPNKNYGEA